MLSVVGFSRHQNQFGIVNVTLYCAPNDCDMKCLRNFTILCTVNVILNLLLIIEFIICDLILVCLFIFIHYKSHSTRNTIDITYCKLDNLLFIFEFMIWNLFLDSLFIDTLQVPFRTQLYQELWVSNLEKSNLAYTIYWDGKWIK